MSEAKLRDALDAVRQDLEPPARPRRGQRPSQAQMEKRCNEFTDALAKQLDKSGDEVRTAIKAAAKKDIEKAVTDGDLTRSQADRILSRIDDAACLPAFGGHGRPRRLRWADRGGRPGRSSPPGTSSWRSGSRGSSSVAPAPTGGSRLRRQ